jgi:hypothetical protein
MFWNVLALMTTNETRTTALVFAAENRRSYEFGNSPD